MSTSTCSVCARPFEPKFRYQVREEAGRFLAFCSQACQQKSLSGEGPCACTVCGRTFALEFAFQVEVGDAGKRLYCSTRCRDASPLARAPAAAPPRPAPRRIAVFNHKGGTGKTTTAINIAAGLAERGERVLLIDCDGQGNVGASLGIRGEQNLYHVLVLGLALEQAVVPVRNNLDVLTSNELLAAAELYLATRPNRDRVMRDRLAHQAHDYDTVVLDCAPALSLMNQNALVYAEGVVIPVSCDYLSLVGVRQVLRTLRNVKQLLHHDVELLGVLPTFFDVRNKICREAVEALTDHFGERRLPPIRVNTKLREAPSVKQTIFEHAPDSHGALDYLTLVERLRAHRTSAGGGWTEPGQPFVPERRYRDSTAGEPAAKVSA